ncbi:hypothetical protein Btru_067901 [Bulinus truncatus]|nr:hypothetical protein Btru_067901 [Bulinus truncatus]
MPTFYLLEYCLDIFFGSRCQFMCNCILGCDIDGRCISKHNHCAKGWFGLGCKYQNLAVKASVDPIRADPIFNQYPPNIKCITDTSLEYLSLSWSTPQNLNWLRIRLSDNVDDNSIRLKHFDLQVRDFNHSLIFTFSDSENETKMVYTVFYFGPGQVAEVTVSQVHNYSSDLIPYVTLNEFEAFGECLPGYWGLECQFKCPSLCADVDLHNDGSCVNVCHEESYIATQTIDVDDQHIDDQLGKYIGAGVGAGLTAVIVTSFFIIIYVRNKMKRSTIRDTQSQHCYSNTEVVQEEKSCYENFQQESNASNRQYDKIEISNES